MHALSARQGAVELTDDARFRGRITRLTVVSAVALGLVSSMAVATLETPAAVDALLIAGWALMPLILLASLSRPRLRYGLVLPASLVSIGLLAIVIGWLPGSVPAAIGWVLLAAGIWLGGGLGLWLWYRILPVPAALDDPFSPGRWALVGTHIVLVIAGFALAATALR
jgi:hypothetical protein